MAKNLEIYRGGGRLAICGVRVNYALVNFMPHPRVSPHPKWGFDIASCPHPWGN